MFTGQHRLLTLLLALGFVVTCLPVVALPGPPGSGPEGPGGPGAGVFGPGAHDMEGRGRGLLPPADFLGLTEEQIAAVEVLRDALRVDLEPLHAERMTLAEALRAELELEAPDPTTVGQLVLDQRTVGRQMRDAFDGFVEDFVALLDEEQLALYEAWREVRGEHRDRRGRGRGGRGHGGPGSGG